MMDRLMHDLMLVALCIVAAAGGWVFMDSVAKRDRFGAWFAGGIISACVLGFAVPQ